jgi:ABC-type antimicrobial peptide transport system permease subunit
MLTLAGWQFRQTWKLLVVCGLGMLAAVVLVCAMPLYSRLVLSSGLHNALRSSGSPNVTVQSTVPYLTSAFNVENLNDAVDIVVQNNLPPGSYDANRQTSMQLSLTDITSYPTPGASNQIQLNSWTQSILANHVHLLQGRLPVASKIAGTLEIALIPTNCLFLYRPDPTVSTTQCYTAHVGDTLTVNSWFTGKPLNLKIVGLLKPDNVNDELWSGHSLDNLSYTIQGSTYTLLTGLTTNEALSAEMDQMAASLTGANRYTRFRSTTLSISWSYALSIGQIDPNDVPALTSSIDNLGAAFAQNGTTTDSAQTRVSGPTDVLNEFASRVTLANVPVNLLLLLVGCMVVLFLTLTIELLIERQTEPIGILRSRGATRGQIFSVFAAQLGAPALVALLAGPLLAILLAMAMARVLFPALDPDALTFLTNSPLDAAWYIRWYALLAVGVALFCTLLTLWRMTRADVLALRREQSRPTGKPFWQRFYLDALLALLALGFYLYYYTASTTNSLSDISSLEILSPLVLLASALLLLAGILFFLRLFPRILQFASNRAARQPGVTVLVALAQVSRAPRQASRIILLLTLTTSFTLFALIFSATQAQRAQDLVNYQVGADFGVELPSIATDPFTDVNPDTYSVITQADLNRSYQHIQGVTAASVGMIYPAGFSDSTIYVKAVDTSTYARAAYWDTQDSSQPLSTLLTQLAANRKSGEDQQLIPAIVDAETWNTLNLHVGQHFSLALTSIGGSNTQLTYLALAEVQHIPTMLSFEGGALSAQSVLVDEQSYASVISKVTGNQPVINYVWLRANAGSATGVHTALAQRVSNLLGSISPNSSSQSAISNADSSSGYIADKAELLSEQQNDPLALNLLGVLTLGTLTPLLLALVGSLLLSWMSVRNRLLSFAVLRALGTNPRQLAGILSYEQALTYVTMLFLGISSGLLLAVIALPALISSAVVAPGSSLDTTTALPSLADMPDLHIIYPPLLLLVLGLLIAICGITIGMLARQVSRPAISQTLRLNAD